MTGKRIARPNPPEAWITCAVPELRIIDEPVWRAAQDRLATGRRVLAPDEPASASSQHCAVNAGARLVALRRPRWLLSGLVRCGVCGGPMSVTRSDGRLGCNRHERGTCANNRSVRRDLLVTRVLVGLKDRLLAPELVEEFVRSFVVEINAANRARGARQAKLSRDHAKVSRQIRALLELVKDGHGSAAMVQELRALEQQQEALAAEIAAAGLPEPVPALYPNLPELYRRKVEVLEAALRGPATAAAAAEALRGLIEAILIFPGARRGEVSVELRGDLAAFTRLDEGGDAARPAGNGRSGVLCGIVGCGGAPRFAAGWISDRRWQGWCRGFESLRPLQVYLVRSGRWAGA
jgi:site-specific DNA recombinase